MKKSLLFSGLIVAMTLLCCYALVTADVIHQKKVATTSVVTSKAPAATTIEKANAATVNDPAAGLFSGATKSAALPVPKAEELDKSPIATRPGVTSTEAISAANKAAVAQAEAAEVAKKLEMENAKAALRAPTATASLSNEAPNPRIEELRTRIEELKNQGLYDAALWDEFFRLTTTEKPSGGRLDQGGETCASAQVIASLPYSDTGTTVGYVNDYEPGAWGTGCPYTGGTAPDVVYKYTPTADETVDINLCNSGYDTKVYVFLGSCINANLVACDDDGCGSSYRSVIYGLALTAYNDYYIVVDGYGTSSGAYAMDITYGTPPPPPPECPPGTLFGQNPTDPAGAWSFYTSDNNTSPFNYMVYDNFWGLTSYTCDLHWWGLMLYFSAGWTDCPTENPMTFDIGFYQDAAGLPGAQVGAFTIPVTGVNTGILYSGYPMYYFSTTLSPCVGLAAGWLSIQGVSTGSPDCAFLWANSPTGDLLSYQYDVNVGTMTNLMDDLAFCLTGEGELLGACCDPFNGNCVDNVPAAACQSPSIFYANMLCSQIQPPCGVGACCDPVTGECTQTTYAACQGNWIPGITCDPNPCAGPGADCSNPVVVNLPPATWPYTNNNTTCDMGNDYFNTCLGYYDEGEDIIYQLNVTEAVTVILTLTSDASWVGMCIDDNCPPDASCINYCSTSGSGCTINNVALAVGTYYIMIDTWPSPDCIPNFTLTIDQGGGVQPGEECATAIVIPSLPYTDTRNTCLYSNTCGNPAPDVFYKYTVQSPDEYLTISLCGSSYDTYLYVWSECCVTMLAYNDDYCGLQSEITRCFDPGDIWIQVDGYSSNCGTAILNVTSAGPCPEAPPNDDCADAYVVTLPYEGDGTTAGATDDCAQIAGMPAVWYTFTVPYDCNNLTVEYCNSPIVFDNYLIVLSTDCECSMFYYGAYSWSCPDGNLINRFNGIPAGTYYLPIWVDPAGPFHIYIHNEECAPPPECPPGSLFAQTPTDANGAWSFYTSDNNTYPFWYMCFDNFWGLTSYVCDLHWWGLMLEPIWYDCTSENPMTFDIAFYQDAAGFPGAQVAAFPGISVIGVPTGLFYAGYQMYYFNTALSPCVGLAAGWVSIQGVSTGSPDCAFLWANSPYGDLSSYQYDGATMTQLNDDLAFCLTGEGELIGACCNPIDGTCVDNVTPSQCPYPNLFYANTTCGQLVPPCGMGACCNDLTGECTQTSYTGCQGPDMTWHPGMSCDPNPCPPPGPVNDDCVDATAVTLPYTGTGTTTGATEDCAPLAGYPSVWYVFDLPYGCNNLTVAYCGSAPFATASVLIVLTPDCDCSSFFFYTGVDWYLCGDGCPTIYYDGLAAGTYYLPVWGDPPGDFTISITNESCGELNCQPCDQATFTDAGVPSYPWTFTDSGTTCEWNGLPQNCIWGADWIWSDACGGYQYSTTPKRWYTFTVLCQTTITIVQSPVGTEDPQVALLSGCPTLNGEEDMLNYCIGTADVGVSGDPETIVASVGPGTYWVSVANYGSCGAYDLTITSSDCPLPVELTTFEAIAADRQVALRWTTASEKDNASFDVQRKTASSDWMTIGKVNGVGNSQTPTNYAYTDRAVVNGVTYTYRLISRDINGTTHEYETTVEATPSAPLPTEYALYQNYPNPFNPQTSIAYAVKDAGFVTLKVYNLIGQEVATLVSAKMEAGRYTANFTTTDLPSGVYVYRLEVNNFTAQKKMVLLK
jgi:hypothetical protein